MRKIVIILLACLLASCTICRYQAIKDAEMYERAGYKAQITTYKQGWDGMILGMGIWTHHAQARVFHRGAWRWVSEFGDLSDHSTFIVAGDAVNWKTSDYRAAVEQRYGKID